MRTKNSIKVRLFTLAALAVALGIPASSRAAAVVGGTTSVALDPTTLATLTQAGFSIAPVSPATLTTMGNTTTATFPITGGDTTTMIDHSGGLAFTLSSTTADIEDFVINLNLAQPTITGNLVAGNIGVDGLTLFDIGSGLSLTLAQPLASELSMFFGVPNLTGAPIGTATVSPVLASTPEPSTLGMGLLALLPAAYLIVRRRSVRTASSN